MDKKTERIFLHAVFILQIFLSLYACSDKASKTTPDTVLLDQTPQPAPSRADPPYVPHPFFAEYSKEIHEQFAQYYATPFAIFGEEVTQAAESTEKTGQYSGIQPFAGKNKLPAAILGQIQDVGIGWANADYETMLAPDASGPMLLALYEALAKKVLRGEEATPLFITADLIHESFFTMYKSAKSSIEAVVLLPALRNIIAESVKYFKLEAPKQIQIKKLNDRTVNFFLVADALFALLPQVTTEFDTYENREIVRVIKKSQEKVLSGYPEAVQQDVKNILNAKADWHSEILQKSIDYTLFTHIRNIYKAENNDVVKESFKPSISMESVVYNAMLTWLTLAHLETEHRPGYNSVVYNENAAWMIYMLERIGSNAGLTLALTDFAAMESQLGRNINAQSAPEFMMFLKQKKLVPISAWLADTNKIKTVFTAYNKKILALISKPESMLAAWFREVSHPKFENREHVSGLDALASIIDIGVFGAPLYKKYPSLQQTHTAIRNHTIETSKAGVTANSGTNIDISDNQSTTLLYLFAQETISQDLLPLYTKSPGWFAKNIVSSLNLLALSDSDYNITIPFASHTVSQTTGSEYKAATIPGNLPELEHWLEPTPQYYRSLAKIIEQIIIFQKRHYPAGTGMLSDIQRKAFDRATALFSEYSAFLNMITQIAQNELLGIKRTPEENRFILDIPETLAVLLSKLPATEDYTGASSAVITEETSEYGSSLAATVWEKPEKALYIPSYSLVYRSKTDAGLTELYCAPGLPFILYIPITCLDGKQCIATGFMYSYTEFTQDVGVLTHDEWAHIIFSDEVYLYKLPWE